MSRFLLRYQQEYKFFKMWADKAQRAVEQSGVDMDELLEKVTDGQRCAPPRSCIAALIFALLPLTVPSL